MLNHCSILIVNWNSWELLSSCLQAISKQTYQNFKVFVADNNSDQPSPEGFFSILPDMTFTKNSFNYGFARANNLLLEQAKKSKWVVLLNPDTLPEPNWLEHLMCAAKEYPDYQCFASRLLMAKDPNSLDGDGDSYHFSGLAWRNGRGKTANKKNIPNEVFSACAAASMYLTENVLKSGGFDEDFFCYFEDIDLTFRLRLMGVKCLLVPLAIVHHVGAASSGGSQSNLSVYYGHRNLVWAYVKNMPGLLFWLFMPSHLLLNLFGVVWFTMRGRAPTILRCKWDAIKGIPAMWRKRREIQLKRAVSTISIWHVIDKRLYPRR